MNAYTLYLIYFMFIMFFINIHCLFNRKKSLQNIIQHILYYNFISKNDKIIIYKTFTGCGLGNKIPTIISCIFFSVVSSSTFYIYGWKDILLYFKIPSYFINNNIKINEFIEIRTINNSIKNILSKYNKLSIYKYHGFMNIIYTLYSSNNIIKETNISIYQWNKLIQDVFFKPCQVVHNYIQKFIILKRNTKVIGLHIRTGFLKNLSKTSLWYSPAIYDKYIKTIDSLLSFRSDYKLLIISDSHQIIEQIKKKYYKIILNYSIPGPVADPHYSMHGKNYESGIKLVGDNYLISECDIAVGSHMSTYFTLACSRSNFNCSYI